MLQHCDQGPFLQHGGSRVLTNQPLHCTEAGHTAGRAEQRGPAQQPHADRGRGKGLRLRGGLQTHQGGYWGYGHTGWWGGLKFGCLLLIYTVKAKSYYSPPSAPQLWSMLLKSFKLFAGLM